LVDIFLGLPSYVAKRALVAIALIIFVGTLNFAILHLAPGGPETVFLNPRITPAAKALILKQYGLDKPIQEQYFLYLAGMVTGKWGLSYFYTEPAFDVVVARIPATLLLMVPSLILTVLIGILMGILSVRRPYTFLDRFLSSFAFFFYSMPVFWLGFILLTVFAVFLHVLPAGGMTSITATNFDVLDYLQHLILPMTTLTLINLANFSLLVRSSMIEVLDQNYIMTARGKGLSERLVFYRHALRNGLLPTVTMIGLFIGSILTGAILTETVFSWPGLGSLTYDSISRRDYPVVLALFFIFSILTIFSNLTTDIVYGLLDPRITYD
jgi:peptide/nickel transport system permease protein